MGFVRVKSARVEDPQHEFDVSERELAAHADLYKVVDKRPVKVSRSSRYVKPVRPVVKPVEGDE